MLCSFAPLRKMSWLNNNPGPNIRIRFHNNRQLEPRLSGFLGLRGYPTAKQ